MIETSYSITADEFLEAQMLYQKKKTKRFRVIYLSFIAAMFLASFALFYFPDRDIWGAVVAMAPFGAGFALTLLVLKPIGRWMLRKRLAEGTRQMTGMTLRIHEDGYDYETPGIGSSKILWSAVDDCIEGPATFALVRNPGIFPIPKRAFDEEQMEQLREILLRELRQPATGPAKA